MVYTGLVHLDEGFTEQQWHTEVRAGPGGYLGEVQERCARTVVSAVPEALPPSVGAFLCSTTKLLISCIHFSTLHGIPGRRGTMHWFC